VSTRPNLLLPETYEELANELGTELAKMNQFVVPVEEAEKQLALITSTMRHSGKVVFLLGESGVGKSTFIQSLIDRKFLAIPNIHEIDASLLGPSSSRLDNLYNAIVKKVSEKPSGIQGIVTIAVNYLEDFIGHQEEDIRSFFRDINGFLRNHPVLIIWPTTQKKEIERIIKLVSAVSSTVFTENPILQFNGPNIDRFPAIAKNTIVTLNPGYSINDFQLEDNDFDVLVDKLQLRVPNEQTIRNYLRSVRQDWEERSGQIEYVLSKIPKPTEIWFVVCYPGAEDVVGQFARKSQDADKVWDSDIRKFSEYTTAGQKAAEWSQRKLMQALQGIFTVKIMYLQTPALVACVAAYGKDAAKKKYRKKDHKSFNELIEKVIESVPVRQWREKSTAKRFMKRSPLLYQIEGRVMTFGQRRGRRTISDEARVPFSHINSYISSSRMTGEGSDQPINECLAIGIRETLGLTEDKVMVERPHPYLNDIRPDIIINTNPNKVICVELHYTADDRRYRLATYVLDKMRVYMRQIEAYLESPRLFGDF
jgi:GTPase SAR1 family protein